jgi:hypothetical protein
MAFSSCGPRLMTSSPASMRDDGATGDRDLAERKRKEVIRALLEAALEKLREEP